MKALFAVVILLIVAGAIGYYVYTTQNPSAPVLGASGGTGTIQICSGGTCWVVQSLLINPSVFNNKSDCAFGFDNPVTASTSIGEARVISCGSFVINTKYQ